MNMEHRDARVVVETERYRMTGTLRLARDGYRSRMTDFLNSTDREFIPLTDVEIEPLDRPGQMMREGFVAISRNHIVLATELGGDHS